MALVFAEAGTAQGHEGRGFSYSKRAGGPGCTSCSCRSTAGLDADLAGIDRVGPPMRDPLRTRRLKESDEHESCCREHSPARRAHASGTTRGPTSFIARAGPPKRGRERRS